MAENEERPGTEAEEPLDPGQLAQREPQATTPPEPGQAMPPEPPGQAKQSIPAIIAAAGLLAVGAVLFVAGFWTHALIEEDPDLNPIEEKLATLDSRADNIEEGLAGLSNLLLEMTNQPSGEATSVAAADDPSWGPEDALVTIVEFSDFQCPFCARFWSETLPKIEEAYGEKVRFIYRDFPLTSIHPFAQKAAEAAQCAHEQGLFWEYHDLLFQNQDALAVADLKRYARQLSLDSNKFNDCLDSGKNAREVALDLQDGIRAGVQGTPSFLINGLMVRGAQPFQQFQAVIDQALSAAGE